MQQSDRASKPARHAGAPGKRDALPYILLFILLAGMLTVAAGALLPPHYHAVPALLCSLGFCVSGMLLGFLFGIPRTLPSGTANVAAPDERNGKGRATDDSAPAYAEPNGNAASNTLFLGTPTPMEINSNLVEVSDWLTKIIVGVGLIELKSLPGGARSMAAFIAPSLATDMATAMAVVGVIMLFFSVHGFLIGYLLTRIYLSIMIKRADTLVKYASVRLESGKEIEVAELSRLQQKSLDDMQEAVTQLLLAHPRDGGTPAVAAMAGMPTAQKPASLVLWLDDHPRNNTLLVEQLERENVKVDLATSMQQALAMLQQKHYALLITDMARVENGRRIKDAGVRTVREVRQALPALPIIVYCSKDTVASYGTQAEAAGARFITTSGTSLLAAVSKLVHEERQDGDQSTR